MRAMPKIPYAAEDTLLASVFGMYSSGILLLTLLSGVYNKPAKSDTVSESYKHVNNGSAVKRIVWNTVLV